MRRHRRLVSGHRLLTATLAALLLATTLPAALIVATDPVPERTRPGARVVVGDAEIVHFRDVGMLDGCSDLVLAQEAVEVAHAGPLVRGLVEDLEGDLRAGPLALGQVDARYGAFGELADEAEPADRGVAEARRARRFVDPRGGTRELASPGLGRAQRVHEGCVVDLAARQAGVGAGVDRVLLGLR